MKNNKIKIIICSLWMLATLTTAEATPSNHRYASSEKATLSVTLKSAADPKSKGKPCGFKATAPMCTLNLYVGNPTPSILTITNNSTRITALNIRAILPVGWTDVTQDSSNCNVVLPGATCELHFLPGTTVYPAQEVPVKGDNTKEASIIMAVNPTPVTISADFNSLNYHLAYRAILVNNFGDFAVDFDENTAVDIPGSLVGKVEYCKAGMIDCAYQTDCPAAIPANSTCLIWLKALGNPTPNAESNNVTVTIGTVITMLNVDYAMGLYPGGLFTAAGGISANYIARWNGSSWSSLGTGANNVVSAIAVAPNGDLFAGGLFTTAGGVSSNYIARWNGSTWTALGSGLNGSVLGIAIGANGDVFAGGSFTTAGGTPASNIARWNGTTWSALGAGVNAPVNSITINAGTLYVGGSFNTAGGTPASNIALWDGTTWSALGAGVNAVVQATTLAQSGDLIVGGEFTSAGGGPANRTATWDGSFWSAFGAGMNNGVESLAVATNGDLIAGGTFLTAGTVPANRIARWDGTAWSALGSGLNDETAALIFADNGILFAGGEFTTAGGNPANYIASWDGTNWSPLGTGLSQFAAALGLAPSIIIH